MNLIVYKKFVHFQDSLHAFVRDDISERKKNFHDDSEPPFIMDLQFAIGFSEFEILYQKRLNIRVFRNAPRAVSDIFEFFFAEIVFIQFVKETIIWISCVVFVFGKNGHQIIKTRIVIKLNYSKANKIIVLYVKCSPKIMIFFVPRSKKPVKDIFVHDSVLLHITFINFICDFKTLLLNKFLVNLLKMKTFVGTADFIFFV